MHIAIFICNIIFLNIINTFYYLHYFPHCFITYFNVCLYEYISILYNKRECSQGLGNLVGSFFSCMPITASLSRSLIQQTVGGHTQLASLISCGILVSVLLWIGPFFQPLPRVIILFINFTNFTNLHIVIQAWDGDWNTCAQCVLASIIVVALKGMMMKVTEFMQFWRLDKTDAVIWAVTFVVVVLFDVEFGLLVGVLLCIGRLLVLMMRPYTCKLALAPGTELYLDAKRYKGVWRTCNLKEKLVFLDINLFLLL